MIFSTIGAVDTFILIKFVFHVWFQRLPEGKEGKDFREREKEREKQEESECVRCLGKYNFSDELGKYIF